MNKIFKTKWSAAHQQYVVTDEHHATKGKAAKSVVAATVAAVAAMAAGAASAAYTGYLTDSFNAVTGTDRAAFETEEYKADWGLDAMNASVAYSLGYTGKGAHLGVMDSGALLKHPAYGDDGRITGTDVNHTYGSSGHRYPQSSWDAKGETPANTSKYDQGQTQHATGDWMPGINDSHGTHVTGTVGGAKDGLEMHGVAFESTVLVGNTGATDNNNYGPYQDHDFFKQGWDAIVKGINDANAEDGEKFADRGGVINNSWGTNVRIWLKDGKNVAYKDFDPDKATYKEKKDADGNVVLGSDGKPKYEREYTIGHLATNTWQEAEYEYFYFQNVYNGTGKDANFEKSFVDAAWESIEGTNIVQVFTTGNRDSANPFYRPLYPYFNPDAEKQWVAVAGIQKADNGFELIETFNEAGLGKWWTVAAPGSGIYSSKVDADGNATWGNSSGTSMAAPHVTGAMGVLMSRYKDMTAPQVRDVMFTTATHTNPDGTPFKGWTADEGQVDERMGWGMPDLAKGMFGPGQFLGKFSYNMDTEKLDVWSNDISNVALDQRRAEDEAWIKDVYDQHYDDDAEKDFVLGDGFTIVAPEGEMDKTQIDLEDAQKWRKYYFDLRKGAIEEKLKDGGYEGSLVKDGAGTLVMTGHNTYRGTTVVENGTLLAFAESIGHVDPNEETKEEGTAPEVTVKKDGVFGVIGAYTDSFTKTGYKVSNGEQDGKLTIKLEDGAGLYVGAGSDVTVKTVTFSQNNAVTVGIDGASSEALIAAYRGEDQKSKFTTAEGISFEDAGVKVDASTKLAEDDSLFFKEIKANISEDGKSIETQIVRDEDVSFSNFATTKNERAVAEALEASTDGLAGEILGMTDRKAVESTIASVSDDMYAAARNAMVVNALAVTHAVADQARGFGEGRTAELENGNVRLWATGMGYWGDAEGSESSLDVDFRAGLIGAEVNVCSATKLGAFFGAGTTDYKGNFGKIDGDDTHFGVYGLTDYAGLSFTYGVSYMLEDRDSQHVLRGSADTHSEDASVLQAYAEAAYRFDVAGAKIDPYFGMSWARVESDGFTENGMKTKDREDDIQTATLGARVTMPFTMGTMPVAFKADAGWTHFFGDTEAVTELQLGTNAFAALEAKELKDQFNVGLGLTAQVAKTATVGVSYTSSFGTDADTHGVMGTVKIAF